MEVTIIEMFLTLLVYLSFPISYVFGSGKVNKAKANKLAFINVFLGFIFFSILRFSISNGGSIVNPSGITPAVFYYFISRWILTDKKLVLEKSETVEENELNIND